MLNGDLQYRCVFGCKDVPLIVNTQYDLSFILFKSSEIHVALSSSELAPPLTLFSVSQVNSGAWQQLKENLAVAKTKRPQELGVDGAVPPDPVAIEKIRHKFLNMRKMYSPEKKVSLLLRVCKLIYTIMQDNSGGVKLQLLFLTA